MTSVDLPAKPTARGALHRARRLRPSGRGRAVMRGVGELLITLGLVVLLFAAYEVYGKTAIVNAHQNELEQQLEQQWAASKPAHGPKLTGVPPGGTLARLWIPKLHMHWVVIEGVTLKDLAIAPGHYPGTALPGDVGNFAVAGHRIPAIFWNLQDIRHGDQIVVETREHWYVYDVTVNEIVTPHSVEVIAPTPDRPGVAATKAMLTLTTCNPKWDNYQRMVVHAALVRTTAHSAGPPIPLGS